jgi:F-type H+-transporting ATPase subunit delta
MKSKKAVNRAARELFRLCVVGGELDESRVRLVAERIAASPRRGALRVLAGFKRLVRLDLTRHSALVESAMPLGDPLRAEILAQLAHLYGAKLETSFGENPALSGGVRITVGSDVYDGSVRARLAVIASRL